MKEIFLCIGCLIMTCLYGITFCKRIDPDFVEENGKALKNIRVVPGVRRSTINLHDAEQAAGKAVLHLLDAKIGSKVKEAAKEVTDFLNGAIGTHAKVRANKLHSSKDKELSLLSLTAGQKAADKQKAIKKKKDSFFLNFKIPYLVTPVDKKKKHKTIKKKKKFHGHPHHKHHHKVHHHKLHHKLLNTQPAVPHPAAQPVAHPAVQPHPAQAASPPQSTGNNYNAVDLSWDGYNWSVRPVNDTASPDGMTPCQGQCMDPCNAACNLQTDCCCCPSASTAPQVAPVPQPELQQPPPNYLHMGPATLSPPVATPPMASQTLCAPICKRSCLSYCAQRCCGIQGKRNEVSVAPENSAGPGSGTKEVPKNEQQ